MHWTSKHTEWLVDTGKRLKTANGDTVEVWDFLHLDDDGVLSAWATHFRNHYCSDDEIDYFRKGYKFSRAKYLNQIKFPDKKVAPGPSIRAGDFGEILLADFLEYLLGYWVPRTRYGDKTVRNESTKGCDILGFRFVRKSQKPSAKDTLAIFESKTQFTGNKPKPRLQDAIDGSAKDHARKAESLNAIKRRLFQNDEQVKAERIERFQNEVDDPYVEVNGAVALFESELFDEDVVSVSDTSDHPNKKGLRLIVISGDQMMPLVHELYMRAADEA